MSKDQHRQILRILLATLPISARDIIDEIDLKTLKAPNFLKPAYDKKHFRDMEKQHSKKSKKLYNQGY